jgi:hypothetical protein
MGHGFRSAPFVLAVNQWIEQPIENPMEQIQMQRALQQQGRQQQQNDAQQDVLAYGHTAMLALYCRGPIGDALVDCLRNRRPTGLNWLTRGISRLPCLSRQDTHLAAYCNGFFWGICTAATVSGLGQFVAQVILHLTDALAGAR